MILFIPAFVSLVCFVVPYFAAYGTSKLSEQVRLGVQREGTYRLVCGDERHFSFDDCSLDDAC